MTFIEWAERVVEIVKATPHTYLTMRNLEGYKKILVKSYEFYQMISETEMVYAECQWDEEEKSLYYHNIIIEAIEAIQFQEREERKKIKKRSLLG